MTHNRLVTGSSPVGPTESSYKARQMQSKKLSLVESVVNVVSSFIIGVITQILVFPFYGMKISLMANISLTLIFSLTSFVRSYIVRRIFNGIAEKAANSVG